MDQFIGSCENYPKKLEDFGEYCEKLELWISIDDDFLLDNYLYIHLLQNRPNPQNFENFICLLAAAAGCRVEKLLPRGEIFENSTRLLCSTSSKPRSKLAHVQKIGKFLTITKPSLISADEKSNVIFAIFRILTNFENPEEHLEICHFLRNLIDDDDNLRFVEVFSQVSEDVPKLLKLAFLLLPNLKIVLRLIIEILITVTQRSEFVGDVPSFEIKTRPYCQRSLKLIDEIMEGEKWAWREMLDELLIDLHRQYD